MADTNTTDVFDLGFLPVDPEFQTKNPKIWKIRVTIWIITIINIILILISIDKEHSIAGIFGGWMLTCGFLSMITRMMSPGGVPNMYDYKKVAIPIAFLALP